MKYLSANKCIAKAYLTATAFLILAVVTGLLLGATRVTAGELKALFCGIDSTGANILRLVRLPRVLAGLLCGGALSVSGAVIQTVLANRLASPSIIGVNAGAALAVTACAAFGIVGGWLLSLYAFLGALLSVLLVCIGAKKWGASRSTVILMGVALNSLLGAFSDTITTLIPEVSMLRNDFKIGDLSAVTYNRLLPGAIMAAVVVVLLLLLTNVLEVLMLGEESAMALGVNVGVMRVVLLILAAALSGVAVSIAGLLSFVGLLVPHAVRRIATGAPRHLLPLCLLYGAGFVTFCDTLSRTLFAPYEIPVGIIMAFLGAPFFLFILLRGKGGEANA